MNARRTRKPVGRTPGPPPAGGRASEDTARRLSAEAMREPARPIPHAARLAALFGEPLDGIACHDGPRAGQALDLLQTDGVSTPDGILLRPGATLDVVAEEVAHALQHRRHRGRRGVSTGAEPAEREARQAAGAARAGKPTTIGRGADVELHRSGFSKWGHLALDAAGLLPGVGEPLDLINAAWYAAEGDMTNAALSGMAVIPFLGWGATGAKFGGKALKHSDDLLEGAEQLVKHTDDVVPTGPKVTPTKPTSKKPTPPNAPKTTHHTQPPGGKNTQPPGGKKSNKVDRTPKPPILTRPKGIPKDWTSKLNKTDNSVKWTHPKNVHESVRVKPGNPRSPFENSHGPNVSWKRNGQHLDKNGKVVDAQSKDAHIPLDQFHYFP